MSDIEKRHRRWRVRWRDEQGAQRRKSFGTEAEALEFQRLVAEYAYSPGGRGRGFGRGRARRTRAEVIDVLAANFEVDGNGCWLWQGALTNADYGRLNWKQDGITNVPGAHRVVLHAIGQPVPKGLVVDHLCRVRHCINPDHLEVVRQRENVMRSPIAPGAINAAKTHCAKGHPYTPENTYVWVHTTRSTITRTCKTCQRAYYVRRRDAQIGAAS